MKPGTDRKRTRGRPRAFDLEDRAGTVRALDRALLLLAALARQDSATLTELARDVGIPPSSAHRLLMTLQAHGYADFDESTNLWMVGIEAFRTGNAFARRMNVIDAARDVMATLVEETGETANLAIPDGGDVVFVCQVESTNPVRASFAAGARTPMHASGIGKAFLATRPRMEVEGLLRSHGLASFTDNTRTAPANLFQDLEASRARGWAFDDEERHAGMRCVAAAIFDPYGEAIAGVSISGPSARFTPQAVEAFGSLVGRAAARITEHIGGRLPDSASRA